MIEKKEKGNYARWNSRMLGAARDRRIAIRPENIREKWVKKMKKKNAKTRENTRKKTDEIVEKWLLGMVITVKVYDPWKNTSVGFGKKSKTKGDYTTSQNFR